MRLASEWLSRVLEGSYDLMLVAGGGPLSVRSKECLIQELGGVDMWLRKVIWYYPLVAEGGPISVRSKESHVQELGVAERRVTRMIWSRIRRRRGPNIGQGQGHLHLRPLMAELMERRIICWSRESGHHRTHYSDKESHTPELTSEWPSRGTAKRN